LPLGQRKETASLKQKIWDESYKMRFLQLKQKIDSKKSFFSAKLVFVDLQIILQGMFLGIILEFFERMTFCETAKSQKVAFLSALPPKKTFRFTFLLKSLKGRTKLVIDIRQPFQPTIPIRRYLIFFWNFVKFIFVI